VFAGTEPRYSRPGHVPLSVNLPYVDLRRREIRRHLHRPRPRRL
jgi:3-mercaptopyruvate sulfurtransferase SseA